MGILLLLLRLLVVLSRRLLGDDALKQRCGLDLHILRGFCWWMKQGLRSCFHMAWLSLVLGSCVATLFLHLPPRWKLTKCKHVAATLISPALASSDSGLCKTLLLTRLLMGTQACVLQGDTSCAGQQGCKRERLKGRGGLKEPKANIKQHPTITKDARQKTLTLLSHGSSHSSVSLLQGARWASAAVAVVAHEPSVTVGLPTMAGLVTRSPR